MGSGSKVALVCLRIWQLICSVIVVGILAAFVNRVANGDGPRDGRIIYALVTACLSSAFSIIFIAPFMYSFYAVPGDFILWIMWLVAFCLLDTVCTKHPIFPSSTTLAKLTFCPAHRCPHVQRAVVHKLLGLLLGPTVETTLFRPRVERCRMRPVANRVGLLLHGHVCLPREHDRGKCRP